LCGASTSGAKAHTYLKFWFRVVVPTLRSAKDGAPLFMQLQRESRFFDCALRAPLRMTTLREAQQ
jgi:hypothetical protein